MGRQQRMKRRGLECRRNAAHQVMWLHKQCTCLHHTCDGNGDPSRRKGKEVKGSYRKPDHVLVGNGTHELLSLQRRNTCLNCAYGAPSVVFHVEYAYILLAAKSNGQLDLEALAEWISILFGGCQDNIKCSRFPNFHNIWTKSDWEIPL